MPKVQIIEATKPLYATNTRDPNRHKRVCAYARVSTELEEQQSSYERQIEYFGRYIRENPEWEFVGIYSDRGITATSIEHRKGFKRMIADAKAGKIDLILCKSVSRFARNAADAISVINEFKDHGVEVRFEKENLSSFEEQHEMLFTIFSALSQEESATQGRNIRWGNDKKALAGEAYMNCSRFLGYKNDENGDPVIVKEEAEVVGKIYKMYIDGKTPNYIARYLTDHCVPTPAYKEKWHERTVRSILTNEKYVGDFLTAKQYTISPFDRKVRKNTGQRAQIYIKDHHPAIINREVFDYVQTKIKEKAATNKNGFSESVLAGKLYCAKCGKKLRHHVWTSRGKNKYNTWACGTKYDHDNCEYGPCQLANYRQEIIEEGYVWAIERLLAEKSQYIKKCNQKIAKIRKDLTKSTTKNTIADLYKQRQKYDDELHQLPKRMGNPNEDNCSLAEEMQDILDKIEDITNKINKLEREEQELSGSIYSISMVLDALGGIESIDSFNRDFFRITIDSVIVDDDRLVYRFIGDVVVTASTEKIKERISSKAAQEKGAKNCIGSRDSFHDYVDTRIDEDVSVRRETALV